MPCDEGLLQPFAAQTRCVPCPRDLSVACGAQGEIWINPGYRRPVDSSISGPLLRPNPLAPTLTLARYYRPLHAPIYESLLRSSHDALAVSCPWGAAACMGGTTWGDASCAEGHFGIFCASCRAPQYYRGSSSCLQCPSDTRQAVAVPAALLTYGPLRDRRPLQPSRPARPCGGRCLHSSTLSLHPLTPLR